MRKIAHKTIGEWGGNGTGQRPLRAKFAAGQQPCFAMLLSIRAGFSSTILQSNIMTIFQARALWRCTFICAAVGGWSVPSDITLRLDNG
ncbi:MAG: hypothetical protein CMF31_07970 [Kordiimonas sp.]|nr:hypothetical protein [Kordiimonas sp.]|tara:strand:- start:306 stop:572 length:267 start_codon:yes stop_codon:yes gene_type:complete